MVWFDWWSAMHAQCSIDLVFGSWEMIDSIFTDTVADIVEEEVEERERVVTQGEKVFEIKSFLKM